jgi:hypothetical protein
VNPYSHLAQRPLIAKSAMNGAQLFGLTELFMTGPPATTTTIIYNGEDITKKNGQDRNGQPPASPPQKK